MICRSWPYCNNEAAPGDRFCTAHREILDRVVTGKPKKLRENEPPRNDLRGVEIKIIDALKDGELANPDLARAIEIGYSNGTYKRAKERLMEAGSITERRVKTLKLYALAEQQEKAAA